MAKTIVVFRLTGVRPLLTHNPAQMKRNEGKLEHRHIPTPEEEAAAGLYIDKDGKYVFPSIGIRNCLLKAAKTSRMRFGKIPSASVLSASLFPCDEFVRILNAKTWEPAGEYTVDIRRAVIQRQGITRGRPRFENWGIDIAFEADDTFAKNVPEGALNILNIGGKIVGIGDYRIEKNGLFGQFTAEIRK